jgi:cell division protein FtsB
MTTRQHTTKSGDTFEWEETDELRKALEKLHSRSNKFQESIKDLEQNAPDYGVGK